jgi:hypothetical protein
MSPREYTLHRIILLGLDIKAREGRNDYRVEALRSLYTELKQDIGNPAPHFLKVRQNFLGLDLIHFDRILVDETRVNQLLKRQG